MGKSYDLADLHSYIVPDSPKMLKETLCVAQSGIAELMRNGMTYAGDSMQGHMDRLSRLIEECDRKRPVGPDGKHGDRHTADCGCKTTR
jgi:hypothetical protein